MWQKYFPGVQVFLVMNNLIYMIEIVYLFLKSDSESYNRFKPKNLHINIRCWCVFVILTVVANEVIMQHTQRCLGLCETRQLNRYIVIWLARALRPLEASQHVIRLCNRLLLSVHPFLKSMHLLGSALNVVHNVLMLITHLIKKILN